MKNNKLLKVSHPERGTWYFTNIQKASEWMGIKRTQLVYCFTKNKLTYKDYELGWIDGGEIMYKFINPIYEL